jgi:ankyrin repeat protein
LQAKPLLCCTAAAALCRVAEYALDYNADPNITGPNGTPLIIAAKFRQVSMVNLLCERGADLQMRFGYRNSLDQAVISGAVQVVKTLIRHGADVDVVFDSGSMSAVMQAIALGDSDIVQLLLDAGAALDAEQVCEVLCAMCDKVDDAKAMQIFNLALPHCSSFVDNSELGQKVLLYAVAKNKLQVAQALHAAGVSVHYSDEHGTLMHRAATSGNVAVVQWLQSLGVDARAVSAKTHMLPLHFACEAKHLQLAEYFLSLPGAAGDVHARTAAKWQTPLHCAAASAADSIVELLLQRGANANEVDIIGITPLMAAKSLPVVKLLLSAGADATAATVIGKTVLQCQAQQGACAGTVCLLLKAGADPTVAALTDGNYVTAAHMAGISGHFALEKLLSRAADDYCKKHPTAKRIVYVHTSGSSSSSSSSSSGSTSSSAAAEHSSSGGGGATVGSNISAAAASHATSRSDSVAAAAAAADTSVHARVTPAAQQQQCEQRKAKQPCANCSKPTTKPCRRCAAVNYCSVDCQKVCFADSQHRAQCEAKAAKTA